MLCMLQLNCEVSVLHEATQLGWMEHLRNECYINVVDVQVVHGKHRTTCAPGTYVVKATDMVSSRYIVDLERLHCQCHNATCRGLKAEEQAVSIFRLYSC